MFKLIQIAVLALHAIGMVSTVWAGPKEQVAVAYALQVARINSHPEMQGDDFRRLKANALVPEPDCIETPSTIVQPTPYPVDPASALDPENELIPQAVPPKLNEDEKERRRLQSQLEFVQSELDREKTESSSIRNEYSHRVEESATLTEQLSAIRTELAEAKDKALARSYEVAELKIAAAALQAQIDEKEEPPTPAKAVGMVPMSLTPMTMNLSGPEIGNPISEHPPAQLVIESWAQGCPNCVRLEREIRKEFTPFGWKIGTDETDQIRFVVVPADRPAPRIRLMKRGVQVQEWQGYQPPGPFSYVLRQAWDDASKQSPPTAKATGYAGAIKARSQIAQGIQWMRTYIGEGVKSELRWDRSGAQAFPLLAKGDWSALALFGAYGHFQLSAIGAKNLPLESIGFGYRVNGEDFTIALDPVTIKGLAAKLGMTPAQSQEAFGSLSGPPQIGIFSLWTVFQVVRDIWSLLHPSCDLQLGGNVTATAVLNGDTITVDFQQCPSIKLVALFTFNLGVKQVVISETNVHAQFTGSWMVKSRDFKVE